MSLAFEFATASRIIFGAGRLREIGPLAKQFGRRALVVTGRDPGRAEPLLVAMRASGVEACLYTTAGEPDVGTVVKGVAQAKSARCDTVISFGGGSAIDAGK